MGIRLAGGDRCRVATFDVTDLVVSPALYRCIRVYCADNGVRLPVGITTGPPGNGGDVTCRWTPDLTGPELATVQAIVEHEATIDSHSGFGLALAHAHPYAATSHPHVDGDLPAGLARDAEVAAGFSAIGHTHAPAAPVFATLANGATAMALGTNRAVKVTPTANATYTTTVPVAGEERHIIIVTSGTTSRTITFGTGFRPVGTLATGTVSARVFVVGFISDGTNLYETSRTVAMVA